MTTATEKKFQIDYQIEDDNGNAIGPPQHFEADTQKELLDKVAAAHKNASRKMYDEMKKRKFGDIIAPDPETPIQKFEARPLTADERVRIANASKDPATAIEAYQQMIEATFGAPIEKIRNTLQYSEVRQRIDQSDYESRLFAAAHPDYYPSDANKEKILTWLEKHTPPLAITKKNLELAYEDLTASNMLTLRPPERVSAKPEEVQAPPPPAAIPPAATADPAITGPTTEVQAPLVPKQSSSGLGRSDGSATPPATPPKAPGITMAQINRMTSIDFDRRVREDPVFKKAVEEMRR